MAFESNEKAVLEEYRPWSATKVARRVVFSGHLMTAILKLPGPAESP